VAEQVTVEMLIECLTRCLDDLDRLGEHIPAAHVDTAINALVRRHDSSLYRSKLD